MRPKTFRVGFVRRLIIALISVLCLVYINASAVFALSIDEYFSYSYNLVISRTEVHGNEVFHATIEGEATCNKDLPLPVSQAQITGRVIAKHQVTGNEVILNANYVVTIDSFPNKKDETAQASVVVPLAFPEGSQAGTYTVIGQLIEAKVWVLVAWVNVTSYLPASEEAGAVTYITDIEGTSSEEPTGGQDSDLPDFTDNKGKFTQDHVVKSTDGKVKVTIKQGTTGLTKGGKPLTEITITEMETPPPPPKNTNVVGLVYDFGPEEATFDLPITIELTYSDDQIPTGAAEDSLVIAVWDKETGQWVTLVSSVDPVNNTVTAAVTHFTAYTILVPTHPALFITSNLSITPAEVGIGETVTISVLVTNSGDLEGTHELTLKIDDAGIETRQVILAGGASQKVTFTTAKDTAGTHTVSIDTLSGTFVVKGVAPPPAPAAFSTSDLSITPAEVGIGETVTISVLVTNSGDLEGTHELTLKIDDAGIETRQVILAGGASQKLTFTTAKDTAGTHTVSIDTLSGTFVVGAPPLQPQAPKPSYWWFIAGIIAACIVLGTVIALIGRKAGRG